MEQRVTQKFQVMMEGRKIPATLRSPNCEPPWLDKQAARRGRDLYFQTNAAITLSCMEALIMGMCIPNFYQPLVMSRKSHGKKLATERYTDTAAIVYSWYLADCWETESQTSKNIRKVNAMHRYMAGKVRPVGLDRMPEKTNEVFKESEIDPEANLSYQDKVFLESLSELRDSVKIPKEFWDYVNDSVLFSEMDMTMVQGAFFGQFLHYPEMYGSAWVPKGQVSDLLHLWRANGWYLGIREENNCVLETLEETKLLGQLTLEKILKPCMLFVSPESLHMAKSAVFPGMDYHVTAYTIYETVGYPLPRLWDTFSYFQVFKYYMRKIYQCHIYPLPGIRQLANWLADFALRKTLKVHETKGNKAEKSKDV